MVMEKLLLVKMITTKCWEKKPLLPCLFPPPSQRRRVSVSRRSEEHLGVIYKDANYPGTHFSGETEA
jgi:hypothetical protein